MTDRQQSKIIEDNPIGKGIDGFRTSFNSICEDKSIFCSPDAVDQLSHDDLRNLALLLLPALQSLPVTGFLPSKTGRGTLRSDLLRLISAVASDNFDFDRIKPLLNTALADNIDDTLIWTQVYHAVTESTPAPLPIASSLQQTPWLRNTSSFVNSSEQRKYVDDVLKDELGHMYIGVPGFYEAYFGNIEELEVAAKAVFKKCTEGNTPLYRDGTGWQEWPEDAEQKHVLSWFARLTDQLVSFAEKHLSTPKVQRRPLAQPNQPLQGSTADRKLDVGFVDDPAAGDNSKHYWLHILVPGELKSNPSADTLSKTWLDLGRYAREVLAAQDTRRFVLGFTLCGSHIRLWEFDRLGGIASARFDINQDGLRFVSIILGFLWMNDEQLGFDPTIITADGKRYIEIERDAQKERLIIDALMKRAPCVAGRATTCWKAHREGDDSRTPLVIKDSWQYLEREEEGELLREATENGVVNVARYYYHETVSIGDKIDDIQGNVRKSLDITKAVNYKPDTWIGPPNRKTNQIPKKERSSSAAGRKRSSSCTDAPLPPSKRSCSTSPTKAGRCNALPNRVHRRVIVRDYGKPIYKATSSIALLAALEGCIEGYESLHTKAGMLQRDVSINNLMINEEDDNPSWPSFLIDLDLAIREDRERPSGAWGKTGTRAFMSIGVLLDEEHSPRHDYESFFWVLFWICVHFDSAGRDVGPTEFECWNYENATKLAELKSGLVAREGHFLNRITDSFTLYFKPLVPCVNRLRKIIFPMGAPLEKEDNELCRRMLNVLREAKEDPQVLAGAIGQLT